MVVAVIVIGVILGALVLVDRRLRWYRHCMMRADKHQAAQAAMEVTALSVANIIDVKSADSDQLI
jgi:hypothetical protein